MRVSLLSYKMPEVGGTQYGVFSKIPRHDLNEYKRYFDTSYNNYYINHFENKNDKRNKYTSCGMTSSRASKNLNQYAGVDSDFVKNDKIKITTRLISEKYIENSKNDVKFDNPVQRTWTYHQDPAINAVNILKINNLADSKLSLPPIDNELSLNTKNNVFLEKVKLKIQNGCPKQPTDITKKTIKVNNLRKY